MLRCSRKLLCKFWVEREGEFFPPATNCTVASVDLPLLCCVEYDFSRTCNGMTTIPPSPPQVCGSGFVRSEFLLHVICITLHSKCRPDPSPLSHFFATIPSPLVPVSLGFAFFPPLFPSKLFIWVLGYSVNFQIY
jgi:hypothetical protein